MPWFLNLFQNSKIHSAHDFRDGQCLLVASRQSFKRCLRFCIVFMGSCDFEVEQSADCVGFLSLEDLLVGTAKSFEIFLR